MIQDQFLIEMRRITKRFGSVRALRDFRLTAKGGQVVGLVGDNGAGKSTAMKVLSGFLRPDGGDLLVGGRPVDFKSTLDARRLGIDMVYQDLGLVESMRADENVFLGREITRGRRWSPVRLLNREIMRRKCEEVLAWVGASGLASDSHVATLSGGQRQAVAIARALVSEPRVLVLDEPTAALAPNEVKKVLQIIRKLSQEGICIVMISHRLADIFSVCERVIVMRQGRTVADLLATDTTSGDVVRLMFGLQTA